MDKQTLDQIRSMVEFSAGVAELLLERDELLKTTIYFVDHITRGVPVDFLSREDLAEVQPAMIVVAKARGKSTFGNDWWDALS